MTTKDGRLVIGQLAQGNRGAQAYFIKRVDLFLKAATPPDGSAPLQPNLDLANFMQQWWPAFKTGLPRC